MAEEKNNPYILSESDVPENWKPVEATPIVPGQSSPAPSPSAALPPYFRGTLSQNLQHDAQLVATDKNARVASIPLMPTAPSANPQNNAAIQSVVKTSISSAAVDSDPFMHFRGVWNSFTAYSVNDVVLFNQSSYVCIQGNTNSEPDLPPISTIAVRQTANAGNSGGGSLGVAFANPVLPGSAIVVFIMAQNIGTFQNVLISDTFLSKYTLLVTSPAISSGEFWNSAYIVTNVRGGGSVSVNSVWPSGDTGPGLKYIFVAEVTGLAPSQPDQVSSIATNGSSAYGILCSDASDLIFTGAEANAGILVAPVGFTSSVVTVSSNSAGIAWAQPSFEGTNPVAWTGVTNQFTSVAVSLAPQLSTTKWALIGENAVFNVPATAAQFNPYEVIFFKGSMYVCVRPTTLDPFTDPKSWALWAQGAGGVINNPGNYTPVVGDDARLVYYNSGSPSTFTLPNPPFNSGWWILIQNVGTGVVTINHNGLNINGFAGNITLGQGQGVLIFTDGSNYFTMNGFATVTNTSGSLTLNQVVLGNGGNDIKVQGSLGTVNQVLHGNAAGAPTWSPVVEADQSLSDVTTDNVSTSMHGYAPKLPGDPTKFLNGVGQYVAPNGIVLSDASAAGTLTTHTVSGVLRPGGVIPPAGKYRISADFFLQLNPSAGSLQFSFTYNDGTATRTVSPAPIDTSALNSGETNYTLQTDGIHDITWTMTLV